MIEQGLRVRDDYHTGVIIVTLMQHLHRETRVSRFLFITPRGTEQTGERIVDEMIVICVKTMYEETYIPMPPFDHRNASLPLPDAFIR